MDLLLLGFCALIFLCIVAGCNFYATAKMQEKIRSSRKQHRVLRGEIRELQAALISKREEKKIALSKLRMANAETSAQKAADADTASTSLSSARGQFEEELVSQKVITPRELERVKNYRKSTSCPYGIAETIVMLGYATQYEVDRIKARYPQAI